jgi:uncharacterized repeat protein (TIGR03943 family)
MNPRIRRIIDSLPLLVWSGVLLYFYGSARINTYLATDFRLIALAGGLGLAVLGLFNLLTAGRTAHCGHDHGGEGAHVHEDCDRHPLAAFLIMVVPVVLSVAWTKDAYSISALSRKGLYDAPSGMISPALSSSMAAGMTAEEIEKGHRKTPDGFLEFDLMEIFFATGNRDLQPLLDGLLVQTEGRWMDEKVRNPDGTRKRLYRLFVTCCAADSRPIPIVLEFSGPPPEFPENEWVKVSGTMRFPLENGVIQPVLMAMRAVAAEPPAEENFMRN